MSTITENAEDQCSTSRKVNFFDEDASSKPKDQGKLNFFQRTLLSKPTNSFETKFSSSKPNPLLINVNPSEESTTKQLNRIVTLEGTPSTKDGIFMKELLLGHPTRE